MMCDVPSMAVFRRESIIIIIIIIIISVKFATGINSDATVSMASDQGFATDVSKKKKRYRL
jgi:hypothetical protein